ncbi:DapH/DapD/GlmU-related protein [Streptomyces pratensis]|uniref:DapH/DapD/GlmU-related protein n=1 Tax=Streptomyces pratensis TaxID=1169025 RepID=UPI003643209D
MGTPISFTQPTTHSQLLSMGLLEIGTGCRISPYALIEPVDEQGTLRPVRIGDHAVIGAGAILHGGARIGNEACIEDHVTVGKPETGYAVGHTYCGTGTDTHIGHGVTLRSGAILYAGTRIGDNTAVGHHTLIRSHSHLGADSVLGHFLVIERACHLGDRVRCSPLSHLTSETVLEDGVFLGAGIRTVNDKHLIWRETDRTPTLLPPRFEAGCKVGSGSTILSGITIGERALVGAGSVVTHDVAADSTVYGSPARPRPATAH